MALETIPPTSVPPALPLTTQEVAIDFRRTLRPFTWILVDKDGNVFGKGILRWSEDEGGAEAAAYDTFNPSAKPHAFVPLVLQHEANREVLHWRTNHANLQARVEVLVERPDLPLPRTRAYQTLVRLQDSNSVLSTLLDELGSIVRKARRR